jgi:hypothetical protein
MINDKEKMALYRERPIFGTDFSKPVSVLIEDVRNMLTDARGKLTDIANGTVWEDRVNDMIGLLSCGISSLHYTKSEIVEFEIKTADKLEGKSLTFRPRGIGLDIVPYCFVCGKKIRSPLTDHIGNPYLNNIAAFVASKKEGEEIEQWFGGAARLDYRQHEPNWVQLKVGSCDEHLHNLEKLYELTGQYGLIRKSIIAEALNHVED